MNKVYRIEFNKDGKHIYGKRYVDITLAEIEKGMANKIAGHPIIEVYAKTGKKIIYSFQG